MDDKQIVGCGDVRVRVPDCSEKGGEEKGLGGRLCKRTTIPNKGRTGHQRGGYQIKNVRRVPV